MGSGGVGRDPGAGVRRVVLSGGLEIVERPLMLAGVEGDGALQSLDRGAQHRLPHVLGALPGERGMPPGGGVVAHVERQTGQEVRQLPAEQRQVGALLEALASVKAVLDLLPVVPHLRKQFGVRDAKTFQREAFDVLVKLIQRPGIDGGALASGSDGGRGCRVQQPARW